MHPDEPLLRHIAEKVLRLRRYNPQTLRGQPSNTYAFINGALRVVDQDSKFAFLNPLEDANDALRMAAKTFASFALCFQIGHPAGFRFISKTTPVDEFVEGVSIKAACRAICLACAKTTGWRK